MATAEKTSTIHGVKMIDQVDAVVMKHKRTGSFEDGSMAIWLDSLRDGALAVDVGAYTGIYSIAALKAGSDAMSFEPNPHAVKRARRNARLNGVEIDIQEVALSNCSGLRKLHYKGDRLLSSAASLVDNGGVSETVQVTTLDDISIDLPVSVIKIDAERYEAEVIEGAQGVIDRDHPTVIAECLDGRSTLELMALMRRHGHIPGPVRGSRTMIVWRPK